MTDGEQTITSAVFAGEASRNDLCIIDKRVRKYKEKRGVFSPSALHKGQITLSECLRAAFYGLYFSPAIDRRVHNSVVSAQRRADCKENVSDVSTNSAQRSLAD